MDMKKGFTLIEIMVVITILGVLIAMVSGSFMASQKKSRDLRRKSDLAQISKALEFYSNDNGRYPAASGGLIEGCGNPASPSTCEWNLEWSNTVSTPPTIYMATVPKDPAGGYSYYYDSDATGTYYQLYARFENTEDMDVHKSGSTAQTYTGTNCGGGTECLYGIASPNTTAVANHALH